MLLTGLHRAQSSLRAWAAVSQLRYSSGLTHKFSRPTFGKVAPKEGVAPPIASPAPAPNVGNLYDAKPEYNINIERNSQVSQRKAGSGVPGRTLESSTTPAAISTANAVPSLFDELFPEEAVKAPKPSTDGYKIKSGYRNPGPTTEFPWARAWPTRQDQPEISKVLRTTDVKKQEITATQPRILDHDTKVTPSVLLLSNASKNLSESDFLRLSPKGQHIEGWTSGIIKVIPGRDPTTLAPLGHYFLLFSNPAAARSYQETVIRLHKLSHQHSPRPGSFPIPPPPGFINNGENLHDLVQSFTLIPSSHQGVSIRLLPQPFSPALQQLIKQGCPPVAAKLLQRCENVVIVNLGSDRGAHVAEFYVREWVIKDGITRNIPWGLLDGPDGIVRLDAEKQRWERDRAGDFNEEKRKGPKQNRFVLNFKDALEARRFVRVWHKRPLPKVGEGSEDESPYIVNAELLW